MVKKRLADGTPCRKCVEAEEYLKARGLWSKVDEVLWADDRDASSAGMQLGARLGVGVAPFFVVRGGDNRDTVYESVLALARAIGERVPAVKSATPDGGDLSEEAFVVAERELRDRHPTDILRWGLERWGKGLGIAFSGAEDVVLVQMAHASGLPYSVFCLDTGRLHPETYRFIDLVRKRYSVEIATMSPEAAPLQALVREKGLFSFYDEGHHECCGIRKVEPLRRALGNLRAWATGQRRDQSPSTRGALATVEREKINSGEGASALVKLNPLAGWSSAQTWQYIRENDVPYNPLHERGFISIGCEPCTRATLPGEHERAGRWWWEEATKRECGLHVTPSGEPGSLRYDAQV